MEMSAYKNYWRRVCDAIKRLVATKSKFGQERMSAFPNWQQFAVHQRRNDTGCIPTGYEMLLRAAGAKGIDFKTFQDDFDLDQHGGQPRNHFVSVGEAIKKKYPNVDYVCEPFAKGKGAEKLARVEERVQNRQPVLISLAQTPVGGWHIMPVVDSDANSVTLLEHVDKDGNVHTKTIQKTDFVTRHDYWKGGDEIAYITKF